MTEQQDMFNTDLLIYAAHGVFWASFGITRLLTRAGPEHPKEQVASPGVVQEERTAPYSRTILAMHMVAFGVMYYGIAAAVFPAQVPVWFAGQRIAGTAVIALGSMLMSWALASFQSWRFRATLDAGHQLATNGPFALLRHPLYMGMNLLALGTAVWIPTLAVWIGFVLMVVGSDIRARSEETLLRRAFGAVYTDYCARTRRFIPHVY